VSCFRPIKIAWRKVLKAYKRTRRGPIPKEIFPRLLKKTLEKLEISQISNIKAGFEATGIYPINREKVLKRLPVEELDSINSSASIIIPEALHDIIKETRFGKVSEKVSKRKKYSIKAGCSVTEESILFNNEEIIENAITTINTKEKKKVKKRKNEENVLIESERMLIVDETEINNSDQNILPENDYMIVTDETEFNNKIVQNILNDNDDDIIDETECNNINKTEQYSTPTDYKTEKKKKEKKRKNNS